VFEFPQSIQTYVKQTARKKISIAKDVLMNCLNKNATALWPL